MKLAGRERVNRSPRATEVLRTPEQPRKEPWDPGDVEVFLRWFQKAENFDSRQLGYAAFDLSVIAPHLVTPETRRSVVAGSTAQMKYSLEIWQKGKQQGDFSLGSFAEYMVPALLLDPKARLEAPKKYWDEMHALVQDSDHWYRNYLRAYALQFPGRLDSRADEIFEHLHTQLEEYRQRSRDVGHDLAADLATIRLVAPRRFPEVQFTQADRQIIQEHLRSERQRVEGEDGPWGSYPEELFLAMVALADEVTLSQDKGLQLEFAAPAAASAPALPERPSF